MTHDGSRVSTAAWARAYAQAGWRVFPAWPGQKRPMYEGWQAGATNDPELIERYWSDDTRNIAVACGDPFDAWDIEAPHLERFTTWMAANGYTLPESPIARTGRGGWHIITDPTGVNGNRYLFLEGVHIGELKSTGGLIIISPSVTEQRYSWLWTTPMLRTSPAPDWLQGLVRQPQKVYDRPPWPQVSLSPETDLAPLIRSVRNASSGNRNAELHWAANRACDDGVPHEMAEERLLDGFMETTQPYERTDERRHEAVATIRSAYNR